MHEWKYIFHENVLLLELITDVPFINDENYVIKADDVKLKTEQRHFKGVTVQDTILLQ